MHKRGIRRVCECNARRFPPPDCRDEADFAPKANSKVDLDKYLAAVNGLARYLYSLLGPCSTLDPGYLLDIAGMSPKGGEMELSSLAPLIHEGLDNGSIFFGLSPPSQDYPRSSWPGHLGCVPGQGLPNHLVGPRRSKWKDRCPSSPHPSPRSIEHNAPWQLSPVLS
jgi:hypothetical protein